MKSPRGSIESPNYPNDYPSSSDCAWTLDFGPGIFVRVHFDNFNLEEQSTCSFDYVSLLDGPNQTSPILDGTTTYCGNLRPPNITHLGPLTIRFRSDKDTARKGFSALYDTWGKIWHFLSLLNDTYEIQDACLFSIFIFSISQHLL